MDKYKYKTIASASEGEYKDRGSKFLAYAYPVKTEEKVRELLEQIKKDHPKARHYCYAFRIGFSGDLFRLNDDGEPSGTAGKPILGAIDHFNLINTLIVVVRYFGGTKLGTSGLIKAYKESSLDALSKAKVIEKEWTITYEIELDYSISGPFLAWLKNEPVVLDHLYQKEKMTCHILIPKSELENGFIQRLIAFIGNKHVEEVTLQTKIEGLSFKEIASEF